MTQTVTSCSTEKTSESVVEFFPFLKRRMFGNSILHYEIIPARRGLSTNSISEFPKNLPQKLYAANISSFCTHQKDGIPQIFDRKNTVVATASGKTLIYNIPILSTLLGNLNSRALYIFPLKALVQDQFEEIK